MTHSYRHICLVLLSVCRLACMKCYIDMCVPDLSPRSFKMNPASARSSSTEGAVIIEGRLPMLHKEQHASHSTDQWCPLSSPQVSNSCSVYIHTNFMPLPLYQPWPNAMTVLNIPGLYGTHCADCTIQADRSNAARVTVYINGISGMSTIHFSGHRIHITVRETCEGRLQSKTPELSVRNINAVKKESMFFRNLKSSPSAPIFCLSHLDGKVYHQTKFP